MSVWAALVATINSAGGFRNLRSAEASVVRGGYLAESLAALIFQEKLRVLKHLGLLACCAHASDAETRCLQTRPRPRVSSDFRRSTPPPVPPWLFRVRSEAHTCAPRRCKRRPSAAAAVPGRHLSGRQLTANISSGLRLPSRTHLGSTDLGGAAHM